MLVTVKEYADIHGLKKDTVHTAIKRGLLVVKKKDRNKFYVDSDAPWSGWSKYHKRGEACAEKHTISYDPAYYTWQNMKKRCYNPRFSAYKRYGGRGIKVCDEWLDSYVFIKWMYENGWKKGLTIDRIDNDGNYCPENCRIITRSENSKKVWEERRAGRSTT